MEHTIIISGECELKLRARKGKRRGFVKLRTEIKYVRIAPNGGF